MSSREQRLEAALRELVDAVWVTPADNVRWEAVRAQVDAVVVAEFSDDGPVFDVGDLLPAAAPQGEPEPSDGEGS